jgi:hypothetical protein
VPRWFSFTSFMAANVLIDTEVLFYVWQRDPPLHRHFHTYLGGIGMGIVAGVSVCVASRVLRRAAPGLPRRWPTECAASRTAALIAGILGGSSHVFLDSLVHREMQPFWPLAIDNHLVGLVGHGTVHQGCAALGILGAVFWLLLNATYPGAASSKG